VGTRSPSLRAAGYALLLLALLGAGCRKEGPAEDPPDLEKMARSLQTNYPEDEGGVYIDQAFWVDMERSRKTTVRETMQELGAYRRDGKVYDAQGQELYFYKVRNRHPHDPRPQKTYPDHAAAHEALAWYLLTGPIPIRHPPTALRHAQRAVELQGDRAAFLNTLGVALYRNGHYPRAVRVLQQSLVASNRQNDGFDLFFLSMCHARLGDRVKAKECLERAVQWVGGYRSLSVERATELKQFRDEAERALAGKAP
jgi:tetratricopeptide (TPR) repeat protein